MCIFCRESNKIVARRFKILDANTKESRRYNTVGRQRTVLLIPPSGNSNPVAYILACANDCIEHVLREENVVIYWG